MTLLALAVSVEAIDLPDRIADQKRAFERGDTPPGGLDLRSRLTKVGNNGRLDIWDVALDTAAAHPWQGAGAGTFQLAWERDRPAPPARVVDAHSLYFEQRAELGWIGVGLLFVVFAVPLGAGDRAVARAGRHRTRPSWRPRRRCSSTRSSTGTGRCPRCSCGSSARRAR